MTIEERLREASREIKRRLWSWVPYETQPTTDEVMGIIVAELAARGLAVCEKDARPTCENCGAPGTSFARPSAIRRL